MSKRPKPSFNHTRADGPFDPCSVCLKLMSRKSLIAWQISDMGQIGNMINEVT